MKQNSCESVTQSTPKASQPVRMLRQQQPIASGVPSHRLRSRRLLTDWRLRIVLIVILLGSLTLTPISALATGCMTSGPVSGAYTITLCISSPADGATVTGLQPITATATVSGASPGINKLLFYLDGNYLITDYQTAYTFNMPSDHFVDGAHALSAAAVMRDGFQSQQASTTLVFNNGVSQPPVNTGSFTPTAGTTPAPGQTFVLAATGDGASGETSAGNVTNLIASWNPNMMLYLGDVYNDGTPTEFYNWYGTANTFYGRFRSITNPTIGNHEYQGVQAPGYFDYWDNIPHYFSFDAAGWHFISLDSTSQFNQSAPGSPQYDWLVQDLNANSSACTIAYFHHPIYNVGPEGETPRMSDIWALLVQHGVDLVLTGHDHSYQRWVPLNGSGAPDSAGLTQFVVGTGGHGIQDFIRSDNRLAVGFDTSPYAFGALRLELNQDGSAYQFVNTQGAMLDSGSMACSSATADTTPPSMPANLTAAARSSTHADLTWAAATDNVGVTGYDIYRNGTLLASIGPAKSYTDATLTSGTAYDYQVRARDAAGNTSNLSAVATVRTHAVLFSDGFENGNLSAWSFSTGLIVQQQEVMNGSYAARGTSTGTATYAYKQLSVAQSDLYYRIKFKIVSQGASSVYLQRFRTTSGTALLGVYVSSTGKLGYRNDVTGVSTTSTANVSTGSWHELQTRVVVNGSASQTEVWLDGNRIGALSKTESLGTAAVGRVQFGENSTGRVYDIAFDDNVVDTSFINNNDITSPSVVLTEPANNAKVRGIVQLSADASDNVGVDRVEFLVGGTLVGTDYTAPYSLSWNSASGSDGSTSITARAVDAASNVTNSASRTVIVDNTPPNTNIDSGPAVSVNSTTATLTFSASEAGATFVCEFDEVEIEDCTSPQSYSDLTPGVHAFEVIATDSAGNIDPTPASRTWTIDTTTPTVTSVTPADGAVDVALTTNVEAVFSKAIDATTLATSNFTLAAQGGATSLAATVSYDPSTRKATLDPDTSLQNDTSYIATIKGGVGGVKDVAGNPLAADEVWSFTTSASDTTPPSTPTGLSATVFSATRVDLVWTAATDNVGVTGYDIYRGGALLAAIGPVTSYSDTAVAPGTSYQYQVRAHDAAGNASSASNMVTVGTPARLFFDGFESGNLSQWTTVSGLTVQQQEVYNGNYAVRATSSGTATYAYKQLSAAQSTLYYRTRFKIISQGASSVNLLKVRTGSTVSLLGVFVSSTGKLSYRNDLTSTNATSSITISQGVWHDLQIRVVINGTASQTEVWFDGSRVDALSKIESLGTTPIGRIQLGENSAGRTYDIAFDGVEIDTIFISP
jgi:fibronectin type 3 domain-containing protein